MSSYFTKHAALFYKIPNNGNFATNIFSSCIFSFTENELGKNVTRLLVINRIKPEQSAPYSPHQNGTAERPWRTIFSLARCLLIESKLPPNLCVYALMASAYIRSRCYNKNTRKNTYESFTGSKPYLNAYFWYDLFL